MEQFKIQTIEFIGLLLVITALGVITGAAFIASLLAGLFTLAGIMLVTGLTLVYVAAWREAKARDTGQHAAGGPRLRTAA